MELFSNVCICMTQKSSFDNWMLQRTKERKRQNETEKKAKKKVTKADMSRRKGHDFLTRKASMKNVHKIVEKQPNPRLFSNQQDKKVVCSPEDMNINGSTLDNLMLLSRLATNNEFVVD